MGECARTLKFLHVFPVCTGRVDVVAVTDNRKLVLVVKAVETALGKPRDEVAVAPASANACLAEVALLVFLLQFEVHNLVLSAVLYAGKLFLLRLVVVNLNLRNGFCINVLSDHLGVITEKVLAINIDLADILAHRLYSAVSINFNAWKFLQQVFYGRAGCNLESCGIVFHGITFK